MIDNGDFPQLFTVKNVVGLTLTGFFPVLAYLQLPLASYLKSARVSWGDQTTFVGFLFHVLREDYGTLKLVKTEESGDIILNSKFLLTDLHREFTISVLLLAVFGVFSILWMRNRLLWISFLVLNIMSYLGFFCSFANIKDISGLYHGVIERFWMQPSLYVVLLAGEGLNGLLKLARARETVVLPFAFLIVALRVHSNYKTCDRSSNHHIENFGRHMLSILPQNTILLTSGDLSTNTFRYLTIAEQVRPDVDVLDMSFMGSAWYIPIVGKHMPMVVFPGLGYSQRARFHMRLYDLEMFLDANIPKRPVFVCLKPPKDTRDTVKYDMLPFSFCHQFVRKGTVNPLMYGQNMPVPGFDSYLPPRAEHFDEGAWETVLVHEYWDAKVKPGRFLWQMGESIQNVELKKQYYLASFEYLKKAKSDIRKLIDEDTISPLSWNHTSYYSKYMGVQCRQLWIYSSKNKNKYYQCQQKYLQEYVDSAAEVTRNFDNDFKNIQMILNNPGM